MEQRYQDWIDENVPSYPLGLCGSVTLEMVQAFTELKRVRGLYNCPFDGCRSHWWCIAPDGTIVDPTAAQFTSKGLMGEYVPWIEGSPEPTGKCPDCGELVYGRAIFCDQECRRRTEDYLGVKFATYSRTEA